MKKRYLISLTFFCISTTNFAQHMADKWYFGNMAGLDFSGGTPVPITSSQMAAGEGSASVSDPVTGDLLFYTDGINVWNANNTIMPNGSGLMGGISSTQVALIVPKPGSNNDYYIFTSDQTGGSLGLRFSTVNMSLDGGNGNVVAKNVLLQTPVTEKITAVKQPGTANYWLVAHGWNEDAFYAYKITASGISQAVVSHSGIVHNDSVIQNSYGQMKFNTCGDRLALAAGYLDKVEIFDFDVATGMVSNPQTISYSDHVYGIEFSPNSDLLYVSTYEAGGTLLQYDLTLPNTAAMIAAVQIISTTPDIYPLQRGPDGKIYVVKSYSQYVGVIQSPDFVGTLACNYIDNAIDLDAGSMGLNSGIGLPNFVTSSLGGASLCPGASAGTGENVLQANRVFPNPSNESFTFVIKDNSSRTEIAITDASGKLIEIHEGLAGTTFSFGENYVAGVYFLHITNEFGINGVLRVVKTN
ncbi:MAG: hypothetical protein K0S23_891 [Fluviicola sp.]|jgi:hypothetical protein|uniref:T9SS type A sorting domain-containing protein n=1 Tax=Fluviicola sp. TaxID=1917219 RepID=UPI0026212575|nr:T9SS type A sorting domain-containing protein [Fluviicola sp.]MDF3026584.1 hypothetical protein [Fluviicola sp.]